MTETVTMKNKNMLGALDMALDVFENDKPTWKKYRPPQEKNVSHGRNPLINITNYFTSWIKQIFYIVFTLISTQIAVGNC